MRCLFVTLLLFFAVTASAQFAGYYKLPLEKEKEANVHLVLEPSGHFHFFIDNHYFRGSWHMKDKGKAELKLDVIDPVYVFVADGRHRRGRMSFSDFVGKPYFVHFGFNQTATPSFRPVCVREPECAYTERQDMDVDRDELADVTFVANISGDTTAPEQGVKTCYTYVIPGAYDELYFIANSDAFQKERNVDMKFEAGRYTIGDNELVKQKGEDPAQVVAKQTQLWEEAAVGKLKKDNRLKEGRVKRLQPKITSGRISIARDYPLFHIECEKADDFPPVLPPAQR